MKGVEIKRFLRLPIRQGWQICAFAMCFILVLISEAKGQGIEIKKFDMSSEDGRLINEYIHQSEQKYIISAKGVGEKQGPRMVKAIQLISADLLGELTNLKHERYLINAEVLIVDVKKGETIRITPQSLELLRNIRYIYLRKAGSASATEIQSYFVGFESEEGEDPVLVLFVEGTGAEV